MNVNVEPGQFALDQLPFQFEKCRERFHKMFTESTIGFYFKHKPGQSRNIAQFIYKTELVLEESTFSKFSETNRDTVLWFEPSRFWKYCPMRRSLLTILVRCGMLYDPDEDNYEDALFGHEYVIPTRKAVMRFLFGFTKYIGPTLKTEMSVQNKGWKMVFEGKSDQYVREILVRSEERKSCVPVVESYPTLWN